MEALGKVSNVVTVSPGQLHIAQTLGPPFHLNHGLDRQSDREDALVGPKLVAVTGSFPPCRPLEP